jgi:hypothetical protein
MSKFTRAVLALFAVVGLAGDSFAQSVVSRADVSGQFATLRLSDFDATSLGLGGRLTYNLSRRVAVEGEYSFFPHDDVTTTGSLPGLGIKYERRRSEAFFGTKIGIAGGERFRVFARVRPGFTRLTHSGVECVGQVCAQALMLLAVPTYRTEFAFDLGGGVEFYPSRRTLARVDVGDTLIWHRSTAPPCWTGDCTSQNFASRFSFGVRF